MAGLKQTFQKQGGFSMIRRWSRAGVLFFGTAAALLLGFSKKSLEILRLAVNNRILGKLRKKYSSCIREFTATAQSSQQIRSNKVWVCWLQGMEQAPELVQRCYQSLKDNLTDREIVLLTQENYREFVTFPEHIQQKLDAGIITKTHFSDLLRLELLIRHGGTWIDATVFCSGGQIPSYMLDSDLFVFQNLKPGADGHCTLLSSWFMSACTNHPILLLTRHLLYTYWKKHNNMVDYFLLHDFFQLATEAYPAEWAKVIPFSNATPHILLLRLFDPLNTAAYDAICHQTPFHKLSYKFHDSQFALEDTYYRHILK